MKYLKKYSLFESLNSKSNIVDKVKWYSNYLHQYMKDVNKFTTSNLNFGFSYNTELRIDQIFETAGFLNHDSTDGFIRAVCNEFITWSDYMLRTNWNLKDKSLTFQIDTEYENYTDEYKIENTSKLYRQNNYFPLYLAVGRDIKELISGTIWDIPTDKKEFTDEDNDFIIESLLMDFDVDDDYFEPISGNRRLYNGFDFKFAYKTNDRGVLIKIPKPKKEVISYDSDFIERLQSYFGGVLILEGSSYHSTVKLYLPFYT